MRGTLSQPLLPPSPNKAVVGPSQTVPQDDAKAYQELLKWLQTRDGKQRNWQKPLIL